MNNDFSMDNHDMERAVMTFNNAGVQHEQAISTLSGSFNDIKQTGLFANGLNKISKQLDTLYETSSSLKNVIQKQTEDTFTMEMMLKSKAEEIEIPDYFVTNNTASIIDTKSINADKTDGKSVNEGTSGEINNELNDSMIRKENLQSTLKDTPVASNTNIDINVENKDVGLKNINNNSENTEASLDALVDGQEVNLTNINNQDAPQETSVKFDSEITKINDESLAINNNGTSHNDSDSNDINYKDDGYANKLTSINNQTSETNEVNYTNNSNLTDQVNLSNQTNNNSSDQVNLDNQMNNNLTNQVNLNNQTNNNPSNQVSINNQTNNNFSSQVNLNNQTNNSSLNMSSYSSSSSSSNYNFEGDKDEKEKKPDESNNYNYNYNFNSSINRQAEEDDEDDDEDYYLYE